MMKADTATILCVDDEKNILAALRRLLRKEPYRLLTAGSAAEGLKILENAHPWVIISDQRMPETDGVTFLKKVRETHPDIIRITLTGYTDVETIKEAVNQGHIFKFLLKPWNDENLILDIRQAVNQYKLAAANRELNDRVMVQNEELRHMNDHLENLVKQRTEEIIVRNQALEFSQAILSDLPVPLIGVGADGMIAMTNHAMKTMFQEPFRFEVGRMIEDYFKSEILQSVGKVLSQESPHTTESGELGGVAFTMQCVPLSEHFKGQGVILMFQPVTTTI
jgi:response regulator RpfG family c-di-GMP phosphodiesterase